MRAGGFVGWRSLVVRCGVGIIRLGREGRMGREVRRLEESAVSGVGSIVMVALCAWMRGDGTGMADLETS